MESSSSGQQTAGDASGPKGLADLRKLWQDTKRQRQKGRRRTTPRTPTTEEADHGKK